MKVPIPSNNVLSLYQMEDLKVCEVNSDNTLKKCVTLKLPKMPQFEFQQPQMTLLPMNSVGESVVKFDRPMDKKSLLRLVSAQNQEVLVGEEIHPTIRVFVQPKGKLDVDSIKVNGAFSLDDQSNSLTLKVAFKNPEYRSIYVEKDKLQVQIANYYEVCDEDGSPLGISSEGAYKDEKAMLTIEQTIIRQIDPAEKPGLGVTVSKGIIGIAIVLLSYF